MSAPNAKFRKWVVQIVGPFIAASSCLCAYHSCCEVAILRKIGRLHHLGCLNTVNRNAQPKTARSRICDIDGVHDKRTVLFVGPRNLYPSIWSSKQVARLNLSRSPFFGNLQHRAAGYTAFLLLVGYETSRMPPVSI